MLRYKDFLLHFINLQLCVLFLCLICKQKFTRMNNEMLNLRYQTLNMQWVFRSMVLVCLPLLPCSKRNIVLLCIYKFPTFSFSEYVNFDWPIGNSDKLYIHPSAHTLVHHPTQEMKMMRKHPITYMCCV